MKTLTFKGGLHPNDHKAETAGCAIRDIPASDIMVYPVQQHIGAPCQPIVKAGDRVLVGQKIADSDAFISAPIHSTVSGTVTAIEPRLHPNGRMVTSIVVENDFSYETVDSIYEHKDASSLSKEEKLNIIRELGLVGLGGATFPTHVKLNPPEDKEISCLS